MKRGRKGRDATQDTSCPHCMSKRRDGAPKKSNVVPKLKIATHHATHDMSRIVQYASRSLQNKHTSQRCNSPYHIYEVVEYAHRVFGVIADRYVGLT